MGVVIVLEKDHFAIFPVDCKATVRVFSEFRTSVPDWEHRFVQSGYFKTKELDIYFADVQEVASEIVRTSDAGVNTATWRRYGEADDLQLIEILGQQILNNHQSYKSFIRCKIYDPSSTIAAHSVIEYESKAYQIVGYIRDFRDGSWNLDLAEILNSDVSQNHVAYKLSTVNGE